MQQHNSATVDDLAASLGVTLPARGKAGAKQKHNTLDAWDFIVEVSVLCSEKKRSVSSVCNFLAKPAQQHRLPPGLRGNDAVTLGNQFSLFIKGIGFSPDFAGAKNAIKLLADQEARDVIAPRERRLNPQQR
jgi:hypothetical protein